MTIKTKIVLTLGLILGFVLAGAGFTYFTANRQLASLTVVGSTAESVVTNSITLVRLAEHLQLDVVEVQQFFSEASATHDQASFGEADKFAKKFAADLGSATAIATKAHRPDLARILAGMKDAFGPYYATGQKMAHAYIDNGPAAGNAIMADFDKRADVINEKIQELRNSTNAMTAASAGKLRAKINEIETGAGRQVTITVILALLGILVSVGCGFLLLGGVLRPFAAIGDCMRRLAAGDLAIEIAGVGRRDEVGAMADSVKVFKDSMVESNRLRTEQERLERQAESDKKALFEKMASDFTSGVGTALDAVASAAVDMRATSHSMSATAEETSVQATTVAAAAEQASVNVRTVTSATDGLSASVAEIGRQVAQSTMIAGQAVDEANRTDTIVQGLSAATEKIGDVVQLISDVANQTNLLALNATIEAARAGEGGKGFAVVASEVKSLANQTAKATDEITVQITAIQNSTNEAVQAIHAISTTISRINEIANAIAAAVEEQGAATQEIARNVQEASQGTTQVSSNIVGVKQAASETGSAASRVLASAEALGGHAQTLRANVDKFLSNIRAA